MSETSFEPITRGRVRTRTTNVRRAARSVVLAAVLAAQQGCAPLASPPVAEIGPQQAAISPNVVVILVDDLGWPDVSAYGRNNVPTPNIDRIARAGVAFTNGYVSASVCAVSRAGLLTGRNPAEIGFTYNITDRGGALPGMGLPVGQLTLGDRLKSQGYSTGAFGKWHQGAEPAFYPTNRGFDEFFGFLAGETIYVDPRTEGIVTTPTKADRYPIDRREGNARIIEGPDAVPVDNSDQYLTEAITDRTVEFITSKSAEGRPFFAYVAYNAPHWPLQVPQRYYDQFPQIQDPVRRTYVAMIAALDEGVGQILDSLEEQGVRENTLVVFLSDNGCPHQFGFCEQDHPWGEGKFTYVEGGTRVPFLFSWPAGMAARGLIDTPVSAIDVVPTALRAAARNSTLPADLDGSDLVEIVRNGPTSERTLFWGQDPVFAVRQGRYKLWHSRDWQQTALYDLRNDPAERNDVSSEHPEVKAALEKALEDWRASLPQPRWPLTGTRKVTVNGRETEWVY